MYACMQLVCVRTTLAVDSRVRDRLLQLKGEWGLPSVERVLEQLLEGSPLTAKQLYLRRRRLVERVLQRHKVRRVIAFGSRARGDARPDSDLDLALEFPPDASLLDIAACEQDLCNEFRMRVHVTPLPAQGALAKAIAREGVDLRA